MVKKKAPIGISLPEVMLHQVRIRARDNCRSISREIEYLLQAAMGESWTSSWRRCGR